MKPACSHHHDHSELPSSRNPAVVVKLSTSLQSHSALSTCLTAWKCPGKSTTKPERVALRSNVDSKCEPGKTDNPLSTGQLDLPRKSTLSLSATILVEFKSGKKSVWWWTCFSWENITIFRQKRQKTWPAQCQYLPPYGSSTSQTQIKKRELLIGDITCGQRWLLLKQWCIISGMHCTHCSWTQPADLRAMRIRIHQSTWDEIYPVSCDFWSGTQRSIWKTWHGSDVFINCLFIFSAHTFPHQTKTAVCFSQRKTYLDVCSTHRSPCSVSAFLFQPISLAIPSRLWQFRTQNTEMWKQVFSGVRQSDTTHNGHTAIT